MEMIRHVTIENMLTARDERAQNQNMLREKHCVPIVSFTLNIPGSIKCNELIKKAFRVGKSRVLLAFEKLQAEVLECIEKEDYTGCECIWAVRTNAEQLKHLLCLMEEQDDIGRLFDMDVIDAQGNHLSRNEERSCLICGKPVRACARSRAHSAEELFSKTQDIIRIYFDRKFAEKAGEMAQRALLYEAITTPKPGLVDCNNSGSHLDMNLFHFMESAALLGNYFEACTMLGITNAGFEALQLRGIQAERDMLQQLKVNTHKGAIFALGILCYAWGLCGEESSVECILKAAKKAGTYFLKQMENCIDPKTGGEIQFKQYGITGARGEAASGFETVKKIALPAFIQAMHEGKSLNDSGICAMMALMECVQDSNVIRRCGQEMQRWMNNTAKEINASQWDHALLKKLDKQFIDCNISPGGCADLLAVTYFLYFVNAYIENE